MLEKLLLAMAITFSVNFFLAVNSQQADAEIFLGGNQSVTLNGMQPMAMLTPSFLRSLAPGQENSRVNPG